jgi:hypothetical protein
MPFRFRRSIKLLPGVRINLSKSGVSTTVGVPGATVNISKRGTRGTVGLPHTGISYSERLSDAPQAGGTRVSSVVVLIILSLVVAVWLFH